MILCDFFNARRPARCGNAKTDMMLNAMLNIMMLSKVKKTALALLLLLYFPLSWAITPFVITDIRVEGLERLEAGTVFNYLPLKVGDELNDEEARLSIKELFGTGFFKDVALEQDGTVLVVKVVERPSLSELKIVGNKILDDNALEQALEQAELVQGRIFNSASLGRVEQEIKNTYLSLGRYSATVETMVEELDRNRVADGGAPLTASTAKYNRWPPSSSGMGSRFSNPRLMLMMARNFRKSA